MKNLPLILLILLAAGCQKNTTLESQPPPPEIMFEAEVIEKESEPEIIVPAKPRFVVDNIMNLAPDTLYNILGAPSLKRTEQDVRVWLYRNSECVLHLYFYPNDNGDFRLDYVETTGADLKADNPTVSPNACLDSLVVIDDTAKPVIEDPQPSFDDKDTNLPPDRSDN